MYLFFKQDDIFLISFLMIVLFPKPISFAKLITFIFELHLKEVSVLVREFSIY